MFLDKEGKDMEIASSEEGTLDATGNEDGAEEVIEGAVVSNT